MYSYRGIGIISFLALCAACSARDQTADGQLSETESAIETPPLDGHSVPFPGYKEGSNPPINRWIGSPGELVVADALTACTTDATGGTRGGWVVDASLRGLRTKMNETLGKFSPAPFSWFALRQNATMNFRPISGVATSVSFATHYPADYDSSTFTNAGQFSWAQLALDVAAVNLCIARSVDEQMQLGWNLLIAASDQRYLLETVRERSQLAMLQLGDIAVALQTDDISDASLAPSVQGLRWFAKNGVGTEGRPASDVVSIWAKDLADSVRLHVSATEKLSERLARSASAREPLPDGSGVPLADDFSPASWRQRLLALLYGGNPLEGATAKPGAPPIVIAEANPTSVPWPTRGDVPYASPGSWTPGAIRFLQVAQQHDTVALLLKAATYTGPMDIDADTGNAAEWLYRDLEAKIRTKGCISYPGKPEPCVVVTGDKITGMLPYSTGNVPNLNALTGWSAWNSHQLQPEDSRALVSALVSVLPSAVAGGGFHVMGATNLVTLPGRTKQSLRFDPAVHLVPRTLLETQSVYGRMGRHRVPTVFGDGASLDAIYVGRADDARTKLDGMGDGSVLDGSRLMGAIPALATLRDALQIATASTSTGAGTQPFKQQAPSIVSLLNAAIGGSQFAITPVGAYEQTTTTGTDGRTNRTWRLRVSPSPTDTFWADAPGNYSVSAILDTPQTLSVLADLKSTRAGFASISSLLSGPNAVRAAALTKESSGAFVSAISIPEGSTATFIVRRGAREYRALSGAVTLWAMRIPGGFQTRLPADTRYVVDAGDLTKIAVRASTVAPLDPGAPFYDGFGEPRSHMPSRAELDSSAADLRQFVNKALAIGRETSSNAHDAYLAPLLGQIQRNESQQIDVGQAHRRELQSIKDSLTTLCGASGAGGVPECNIDFVTVDSMGPTVSELSALECTDTSGAPMSRPMPNWPAPAGVDCAAVDPNELGNGTACALAAKRGAFSFKVEVARSVACKAWQRAPQFGQGGDLALLLAAQHKAYSTFRDGVTTLGLAGEALVAAAKAADAERVLAATQLNNQHARVALAERQALQKMMEASRAVANSQKSKNEASAELSSVANVDVQDVMNAVSAAKSGAETGASAGAVFGPTGAAVGAIAGGVAGVIGSLFSGDRQEEILRAQNRLNEATRRHHELELQEQDLASYYGFCKSHEPPLPGQLEKWGVCPDENKLTDTLMELYASEKLEAEQARTVTIAQTFASVTQSKTQFAERMGMAWSNASDLGSSSIILRNAVQTAKLDIERARLEQELVVDRARQEFAITQFFYSNSISDTHEQLEAARQKLRDARRVLEFAYAVNFSNMTRPVGSQQIAPSAWVDQIYDYDLLPLRGLGTGTGLNPQKLENYGNRIETARTAFEAAYGITITPQSGSFEARIAGPSAFRMASVPTSGGDTQVPVPDPEGNNWAVRCPQGAACAPGGGWCTAPTINIGPDGSIIPASFANVCAPVAPLSAKVQFYLDRWGKLAGTAPDSSTVKLFNGRWSTVAINLYSEFGLRNCVGHPDPGCASGASRIGYTLRHLGPYIPTGADGRSQLVPYFPASVIGRAQDDGTSVEVANPGTGGVWDLFQRQLFAIPLGGLYELEINAVTDRGMPADLGAIRYVQVISKAPIFFEQNAP